MQTLNVEYLNGAREVNVCSQNNLVRFTIGDDIFENSWKELGVREYADRIGLVITTLLSESPKERLAQLFVGRASTCNFLT